MTQIVEHDDSQEEVSLNAGLDLDTGEPEPTQDQLFTDVEPGEVPDLREDVHLVASLEARLQDLAYLREDILRHHGMSRQFAMEGERLLPGFGSGLPMGYYTEQPSATRYRLSLEELSRGMWALIAAAIAAVIAAIVKIFSMWRSSKEDPRKIAADKTQDVKKNEEKLEQTQQATRELVQATHSGEMTTLTPQGEPDKLITMSSLMDDIWENEARHQYITQFLSAPKPVYHDIITHGPYTKAFREVVPAFNQLAMLLRTKVKAIAQVSEMDRHSFLVSDETLSRRVLDTVAQPVTVTFQGHAKTLDQIAQDLNSLRSQLKPASGQPLNIDQMVGAVIEAYKATDVAKFFEAQVPVLDALQDLHMELEKLRKLASSVQTPSTDHNNQGIASVLRETIAAVSHDIQAYHSLYAELSHYGNELDHLAAETVHISQEIENQVYAMARKGQIKVPQSWRERAKRERAASLERLFQNAKPKRN